MWVQPCQQSHQDLISLDTSVIAFVKLGRARKHTRTWQSDWPSDWSCMAMYSNRLGNSASMPGRCVLQNDVCRTSRFLVKIVAAMHSAFHGVVPKTRVGLITKTRILFATSIEDHVDTSSVGVVGRLTNLVCAAKLQRWNTSGWETPRCLPQPARRLPSLSALSSRVSAFHHESRHQPPLARLPFTPDDVWCAILAVESRGDVVSARPQCSSFTDAPFLRACLDALLRSSAVVALRGTCKGVRM